MSNNIVEILNLEAANDDNSVIALSHHAMDNLQLYTWGVVLIKVLFGVFIVYSVYGNATIL